jgi:DUF4097 and DUF4098 domain-containing protein YvlB
MKRVSLLPILLVAPLALSAQQFRGRDYRSRIDTTFAFDKRGTVSLTAANGDIIVTGWSRDQIHVRATSENDNLRLDATGSRVTLDLSGSRRGDTHFEVSVPYGTRVVAHNQSGDVSVRGTKGAVEVQVHSGDVMVEDVAERLDAHAFSGEVRATAVNGDVEIQTMSGDVTLTDVKGTVDVKTVSGDIGIRSAVSKSVRAGSTSGDVEYDSVIDPAGRYDFASHSGDVTLKIPQNTSAQLAVSTWSGGVDSEFPITLRPGEHGIGSANAKKFTFDIGGGSARITAESFSGDITISSRRTNR